MSARYNAPAPRRRRHHNTAGAAASTTRPAASSSTQTVTVPAAPVLRLQLHRRPRVRWTADTHDNEHDGRRSSKSCCIFHKKRAWDESDSESSDSGGEGGESGGGDDCEGCHSGGEEAHRRPVPPDEGRGDGGDPGVESDGSSSSGGPVRWRRGDPPGRK